MRLKLNSDHKNYTSEGEKKKKKTILSEREREMDEKYNHKS